MGLFLILSPFATLSAMMMVGPVGAALFAAAAVASALIVADIWRGRSAKILQIGTALLLASVGAYVLVVDRSLSIIAARTAVDSGLLAIALASLALRFPFTIQYARETVDAQTAARPEFRRANFVLTGAWTAAFVVMLIADLATIYLWLPFWTGLAAAFAARNIAAGYTQWYTASRRARFAAERAGLFVARAAAAGETA